MIGSNDSRRENLGSSRSHSDVFPLPVLGRKRPHGECGRARDVKRCAVTRRVDLACAALNSLSGARAGGGLSQPSSPTQFGSPAGVSARRHLRRCVELVGPPPAGQTCDEALRELNRGDDRYVDGPEAVRRDFDLSRHRFLRDGIEPRDLCGLLEGDARMHAENPDHYIYKSGQELHDTPIEEFVKPYTDPALRGAKFLDLIHAINAVGLLTFRMRARSFVGVFAVSKKNDMQRMVLDCRSANAHHRRPPYTSLSTPGSFCNVDLSDQGLKAADWPHRLPQPRVSTTDLVDSFYQMKYEQVSGYFCFDCPVRAGDFSISSVWCDDAGCHVDVGPDDMIWPAFAGLPMGWTWALHFCHSVLSSAMVTSECLRTGRCRDEVEMTVLHDKRPPPPLRPNAPILAPYVDNANIIAWDEDDATAAVLHLELHLASMGLATHPAEVALEVADVVGVRLDMKRRLIYNKPARTWRLIRGLDALLRRRVVSHWALQSVLGHLVHSFMVRKAALCVLQDTWAFVHRQRGARDGVELPVRVRDELRCAKGLLPVLCCSLGAPFCEEMYMTDASLKGYAVHIGRFDDATIFETGQWRERWRFQSLAAPASLATDVPSTDAVPLCMGKEFDSWTATDTEAKKPRDLIHRLRHAREGDFVQQDSLVPPLHPVVVDPRSWRRVLVGAWSRPEVIHCCEVRASLLTLRRATRDVRNHGRQLVSIGDNLSEILATERGRGHNYELNAQVRRAAALQIGTGMIWRRRHVPTDLNVTDADSRLADDGLLQPGEVLNPKQVIRRLARAGRLRGEGILPSLGGARLAKACHHAARDVRQGMQRGQVAIEVGTGDGYLTGALWQAGLRVAPHCGLGGDARFDLFDTDILAAVQTMVRTGAVWLLVVRPPSWTSRSRASVARRAAWISDKCLHLVAAALELGAYVVLDGPRDSDLWNHPFWKKDKVSRDLRRIIFDQCAYGMCYQKPTVVMSNLPEIHVLALRCVCLGPHLQLRDHRPPISDNILTENEQFDVLGLGPPPGLTDSSELTRKPGTPSWRTSFAKQLPPEFCVAVAALACQVSPDSARRLPHEPAISHVWSQPLFDAQRRPARSLEAPWCPRPWTPHWSDCWTGLESLSGLDAGENGAVRAAATGGRSPQPW